MRVLFEVTSRFDICLKKYLTTYNIVRARMESDLGVNLHTYMIRQKLHALKEEFMSKNLARATLFLSQRKIVMTTGQLRELFELAETNEIDLQSYFSTFDLVKQAKDDGVTVDFMHFILETKL